jgi:hypothetical protein
VTPLEGTLKLKQDAGGYRHYIELPDGEHDDIHCGAALEVLLTEPDRWIGGRYEASLDDNTRARLVLGEFKPYTKYVKWRSVEIELPLGVTARRWIQN